MSNSSSGLKFCNVKDTPYITCNFVCGSNDFAHSNCICSGKHRALLKNLNTALPLDIFTDKEDNFGGLLKNCYEGAKKKIPMSNQKLSFR